MAFNFGAPASTGEASGQSLFGTTNKPASGGNIFGAGGTPNTTSTSFGFGGLPPKASGSDGSPSLFGAPATTGSAENKAPTPSIFGQSATGGSAGTSAGLFGAKKPEASQSSEAPKSVFPGFGTPDKPSTLSASAQPLFGSTTPAMGGSKPFNFSNPSTTPAGAPPPSSTFGASTGGATLFGAKPADDTAKSGFNFGKPATTAAPAPGSSSTSSGLFGSNPASGGFGFGAPSKPAESTLATAPGAALTSGPAPPKPTFSFAPPTSSSAPNPPSSTPATSQPASAAAPSSLFGQPANQPTGSSFFSKPGTEEKPPSKPAFAFPPLSTQASAPAGQITTAPAQKSLFGGVNFGGPTNPPASTAGTTAAATTAPSMSSAAPFSFPPAATQPTQPTSQPTSLPTAAAASTASPFSFTTTPSAAQPTGTSAPAAPTAASSSRFGLPGNSAAQTSTTGPAPPAQSRLRNKTMDEILTRWATDMSRYSKEFKEHAETIARWDQLIVDNSSKIDKLYVRTRTCERQTMSVDMQLAAVENQQSELESWLTKYENDVDEILAKDNANPSELGGPDQERERTYKLAEKLGERLEEMEHDLESMVEEVNAANASLSKNGKADEPITQIVKILNSHLIQLQSIDQGTVALQDKVAAARKSANNLGYLNGSMNGDNGAAVQDFYRSYMGRR